MRHVPSAAGWISLVLGMVAFNAGPSDGLAADSPATAPRRQAPPPPVPPAGARVERDLVYARLGDRSLSLDLYRPEKADGPLPLVIWIHGGGWQSGSKNQTPALMLLAHGFAVASVEYRLSGEAIFPAQINDCKAATRWLRANAAQYELDPDRFGAWGSSAGGHLVALMGTSGDVADLEGDAGPRGVSSRVQAVCDWFGPTDLLQMNREKGKMDHDAAQSPESRMIGGPIQENRDKVARANPITYVTPDDPPFLIMHGDRDDVVIYNQSELLKAALDAAGVANTLVCVKGGGHGFGGAEMPRKDIERQVAEFFERTLKPAAVAAP